MGNFNKERGRGGFKPKNRDISMHQAVCSKCGQRCEVPFRPTGDKPIYCNDCFGKIRNAQGASSDREGRYPRRDFGGGNADVVRQLQEVNTKLDRLIRIMEKPAQEVAPQTIKHGTLKQAVRKAVKSKKKK